MRFQSAKTRTPSVAGLKLILLTLAIFGSASMARADHVTTIDYPGATMTELNAINARGEIVGTAVVAGSRRAFRYENGLFSDIVYPGATQTQAVAINSQGEVAGFYQDAARQFHGFVLDKHGTFSSYDYPTATTGTFFLGMDDSGVLAGEFKIGQAFGTTGYAFLRTREGEWLQLIPPGSTNARANSVNSSGQVVGLMTGGGMRGWLLDHDGNYSIFAVEGATLTNPQKINASGVAVGVYIRGGVQNAFIRTKDGVIHDLDVQPGATSERALGINARGDIVGTYDLGGVRHGFLLEH